jgi:hypothetical protein
MSTGRKAGIRTGELCEALWHVVHTLLRILYEYRASGLGIGHQSAECVTPRRTQYERGPGCARPTSSKAEESEAGARSCASTTQAGGSLCPRGEVGVAGYISDTDWAGLLPPI